MILENLFNLIFFFKLDYFSEKHITDDSLKNVYKENILTKNPSNKNNVKLILRYNNYICIY